MYELVKGCLKLVIYSEKDANSYVNAGWKLVKRPKKKVTTKNGKTNKSFNKRS